MFLDNEELEAIIEPGTYSLSLFTALNYKSTTKPLKTENVTFTFKAEPTNGYRSIDFYNGEEIYYVKVLKDDELLGELPSPPEPTDPSQQFYGWFDDHGVKATEQTVVDGDHIYFAEWQPVGHLVVFHDNGKVIKEQYLADDETLSTIAPSLDPREGYTFDGWAKSDGTMVPMTTKGSQLTDMVTDLYSVWSEEPGPDPPGPDPPEPEDYEEHTVEVIENEDGSTTSIKTDIIERIDGSSDT